MRSEPSQTGAWMVTGDGGLGSMRIVVPLVVAWVYWSSFTEMMHVWSKDPRYSHGFLIPFFAMFLLWRRRDVRGRAKVGMLSGGVGLALVTLGLIGKLFGFYIAFDWLQVASLLLVLSGIALIWGGWPALRWAGPSIGFLFFMIPLPYRVETAVGGPLSMAATGCSTYLLQTLGLPAVQQGNTIVLDDARFGVVDACNGLGMLFTFLALSTAAALLLDRPLLDKALIILCAVPNAFLSNMLRITLTALLHETVGGAVANAVYHDLAGWIMMPLALGMLWIEARVLAHLFIEVEQAGPILPTPVALGSVGGQGRPGDLFPGRNDRPLDGSETVPSRKRFL